MARRAAILASGAAALAGAAATAWWWRDRMAALPASAERAPAIPQAPAPPVEGPPLLDTEAMIGHVARIPTALRWAANPLVWVLDFPSLESQGQALNRAAALIEKGSTPRDRLLDDAALAAAIAADGRDAASWYFGHNYRAADLARLFTLAAQQGIALNPLEAWLGEQVAWSRRVEPSRDAAFLSVPALGPRVDAAARAASLRHELGHGQFYTLPLFAAHVTRVWAQGFSETDRMEMRHFLAREGYDQAQEEVMANEAMAYLLYTADRRFFDPARDLGWSDARADRLRGLLREGAPPEP